MMAKLENRLNWISMESDYQLEQMRTQKLSLASKATPKNYFVPKSFQFNVESPAGPGTAKGNE